MNIIQHLETLSIKNKKIKYVKRNRSNSTLFVLMTSISIKSITFYRHYEILFYLIVENL